MAIYHCSIKVISRGNAKSAVGACAYRSGEKITNEYDGITHDYTRKGGIAFKGVLLPDNAPKEYADRGILWNAVEKVEKEKNSQLARDIEVAIPKEIPRELWQRMMIDYCNHNFVSRGMIVDYAIHDKDDNNPHCHIMLTMRPIDEHGKWKAKSRKEYVLDDSGNRIKLPSGNWKSVKIDTTDWNEQTNAEIWRKNWSEHCNLYLENLGHTERIDHRSYERQGIDQIPTIHMGVSASQMEKKGIATDRGNINRDIAQSNKLIKVNRARITRLMKWQRELKTQPLDLTNVDFRTSVLDKLKATQPAVKNQYQTTKALKMTANIWNFLQTHHIDSMEDFREQIRAINESFYAIQREIITSQKAMTDIDNRLELWSEYQAYVPIKKKYQKLQGKAKEQFYDKHHTELERVEELGNVLKNFTNDKGKISVSDWKKKRTSLEHDVSLCRWKMKAYKEELQTAEKIQQSLDEMLADVKQQPTQSKETQER